MQIYKKCKHIIILEHVIFLYKKSSSRFNFPLPLMRRTTILEPLAVTTSTLKEKEKNIFKQLEKKQYTKETTFQNFLDDLQINET